MSADTLLVGGAVVTVDDDRAVFDPGAVAVADDRIVAVGDRDDVLADHHDAECVDLADSVILPGLVDSHGHAGHALMKDLADGTGDWIEVATDIYFRASDEAFWRASGFLSALERLEAGVTTSQSYLGSMPRADDPKYAEAAVEGYANLGLRFVLGLGPPNPPFPTTYRDVDAGEDVTMTLDRAFETTEAAIESLHGSADGRVSVQVAPGWLVPEFADGSTSSMDSLPLDTDANPKRASEHSVEHLKRALALAERHDTSVQAHCFGGHVQAAADAVPEILSPRLSLAHCAGVTPTEVEIMAENGVSVTHGPLTHAYALARFPVVEAMEAGVSVAFSTDGAAPDRSFDLLPVARVGAQLQRAYFEDLSLLPAGKLIETVTIDAARALGMGDEIGSLEAEKKADVIAVDLRSARLRPRYMLPQRVVHYADGNDVSFVMVDGEVRLRVNEPVGVDVDAILDAADREAMAAIERAGATDALNQHPNTWGAVRY